VSRITPCCTENPNELDLAVSSTYVLGPGRDLQNAALTAQPTFLSGNNGLEVPLNIDVRSD
jgi:hypothetical protein